MHFFWGGKEPYTLRGSLPLAGGEHDDRRHASEVHGHDDDHHSHASRAELEEVQREHYRRECELLCLLVSKGRPMFLRAASAPLRRFRGSCARLPSSSSLPAADLEEEGYLGTRMEHEEDYESLFQDDDEDKSSEESEAEEVGREQGSQEKRRRPSSYIVTAAPAGPEPPVPSPEELEAGKKSTAQAPHPHPHHEHHHKHHHRLWHRAYVRTRHYFQRWLGRKEVPPTHPPLIESFWGFLGGLIGLGRKRRSSR